MQKLCGTFSFYEKDNPTCSLPFDLLNIKKQHTKSVIYMLTFRI